MPALLVFAFWVAQGVDGILALLTRRWRLLRGFEVFAALAITHVVLLPWRNTEIPTHANELQSAAIRTHWREVWAYPVE